tara:strand:+ start:3227 stop:4063 length:837 start_codon:yes stop_codon:yes gene_type:complete
LKLKIVSILYSVITYIVDRIKIEHQTNKLIDEGYSILTKSNCKSLIKSKKKICHIIGSGESLNKTKSLIKKEDFVIGFNFSALSKLKFDVYMIEFYGSNCKKISDLQLKVINDFVSDSTKIILKHYTHKRNDFKYVKENYKNKKPLILKDILVNCYTKESHKFICKNLLLKTTIFNQFSSSVVVAIDLALNLDFDKIILHGVDLKGPYFFQGDNSLKKYMPFDSKNYKVLKKKNTHQVNLGQFNLEKTLKELTKQHDMSKIVTASKNNMLSYCFDSYE